MHMCLQLWVVIKKAVMWDAMEIYVGWGRGELNLFLKGNNVMNRKRRIYPNEWADRCRESDSYLGQ